ncbi:GNAT family N-acetyltransferase [Cellulomonas triticagri]|uniref:GNAT family N-acetyltransferase n=1 Tax=Cellulomonas triticagri TaxID=2483352 RepID=A0A3M2J8H5_9CELL|nr:GNAT family N-acetyltransferase [Cellulomonas triticagri]RMI09184.1 GNAT family N-acetyltransferase [Cellulomonas triticagri]
MVRETTLDDLTADDVARVHERLLAPTFRADELLSPDELVAGWTGPDAGPSAVLLADDEPVAVMLGGWFAGGRVLLLEYLAVDAEARGLGLGARLLGDLLPRWAAAAPGGPGALVLAEVDDPRAWSADAAQGDPVARLRFYARYGARLLPFPYTQPALRPGADRVPGMLLLRLDRTPAGAATGADVAAFLAEHYAAAEGPDALADPAVARMVARARELDVDAGLWPVERWEQVPAD